MIAYAKPTEVEIRYHLVAMVMNEPVCAGSLQRQNRPIVKSPV
jgi:hypothetical protein